MICPKTLGGLGLDPETSQDRFSVAYLVGKAAQVIRELAALSSRARRTGKRLATRTLESGIRFRTAADRAQFAVEAAGLFASCWPRIR